MGVILPDAASSARWETADRKFLGAAFEEAGIEVDIQNAGADKAKFQTIADGMIASGVNALLIVNLDSQTGAAVIDKARLGRHPHHRLRPADARWRCVVLRVVRQRRGRNRHR